MKKYFAIAFIILVVLLLVLRKQTEPASFTPPRAPVETSEPAATPAATPTLEKHEVAPTPAVSPESAQTSKTLTPEELDEIRTEVKMAAASGYTAQRAFQAEWNRFTSDIVFTGWEPPSAELNYKFGYLSAFDAPPVDPKERPQRSSTDAFIGEESHESNEKIRYTPAAEKIRLSDYARYCERGCVASKDSFELLVAVPLDDQGHVDVWTINEKKEIKQVVDGTKP